MVCLPNIIALNKACQCPLRYSTIYEMLTLCAQLVNPTRGTTGEGLLSNVMSDLRMAVQQLSQQLDDMLSDTAAFQSRRLPGLRSLECSDCRHYDGQVVVHLLYLFLLDV